MSAGQNYQKDSEGKPFYFQVVNLLVTPEQAELLYLATDQKIQLVLRNPADHAVVSTYGATTNELFSGGAVRPAKPTLAPLARTAIPTAARGPRLITAAPADPESVSTPKRVAEKPVAPAPAPAKVTVEVYAGDKRTEAVFEQSSGRKK